MNLNVFMQRNMTENNLYRDKLDRLCHEFPETEKERIREAFYYAEVSLSDKKRGNDHPFIEHPLGVAEILVNEVGLGAESLCAYFLHEATRFSSLMLEEIGKKYPKDIMTMVDGLNKISQIRPKDTRLEAENYRKLIISYSTDPRVVLIKISDRLEVMRNLEILPKVSRERKNTETIMLYVPLAHQLGLYRVKSELENLFFKYSDGLHFREITNKLKASSNARQKIVLDFINPLKDKLDACGIKYELKARTKTAYSIWKKMQAQSVPFEGVFDVFAIRFIIEAPLEKEHDLCWQVYSLVTEEYEPDTNRLRDWLTVPKSNGYESLHTTVKMKNGSYVEVQIRTRRMDDVAENGLAAHWAYKGIRREKAMDTWLADVKKMLQNPDRTEYRNVVLQSLDEILVYTPAGDLRKLPKGACVLDFAFDIHSNLGVKCSGAKVNGKVVSIREKLSTGDVVEIMQNRNQKPAADWLNFVVTSKAKAKIRQKLNEEEGKKAAAGRELLQRRLKNWKMDVDDELMNEIVRKFGFRTVNEFLSALGDDAVDVSDVKDFLDGHFSEVDGGRSEKSDKAERQDSEQSVSDTAQKVQGGSRSNYLVIGKLNDIGYSFAKCCNPIYGDDVFAFVTRNGGVKIHRMSCPNAARLMEAYPYRVQMVKWKDNVDDKSFQVNLKIIVEDEFSNGQYIVEAVNRSGASLRSFTVDDRLSGKSRIGYDVKMQVYVTSHQHLDTLISALKRLDGVKNVVRMK